MRQYSRRQIVESLNYWKRQLAEANEDNNGNSNKNKATTDQPVSNADEKAFGLSSSGTLAAMRYAKGFQLPDEEKNNSQVLFNQKWGAIYIIPANQVDDTIQQLAHSNSLKFDKDRDVKPVSAFTPQLMMTILTTMDVAKRRSLFNNAGSQKDKNAQQTNESLSSRYSYRQIVEAINYWNKQLKNLNEDRHSLPGPYNLEGDMSINARISKKTSV